MMVMNRGGIVCSVVDLGLGLGIIVVLIEIEIVVVVVVPKEGFHGYRLLGRG